MAGRHTAGLANAVLRRVAEAGPAWVETLPPPLRHSYPDWIAAEWTAMLGDAEAEALMAAQNEPPELAVRVNTLRTAPLDLGVPAHGDPELPEALVLDAPFDVAASRELRDGAIWPQSRGSMLAARLLAPEPGMRVLDLCSAPGGKAGQLAALMADRGRLVCVERHPGRAAALERTLASQGVTCAEVVVADALEFGEGGFDRILLDPPCSGLGVLAGRPDARWRRTLADAREVAGPAAAHARPRPRPARRRRPARVLGVHDPARRVRRAWSPGGRQTLPHRDGTDGFYVAEAA